MSYILNFLKQNSLILLTITGLSILGMATNNLIPWQYLTYFFVIFRNLLKLIDFIIPTDHLIILMGISILVMSALWSYRGYIWIVDWFRNH